MLHATGLGGPNGRAGAAGLGGIFRSLNNIIIAKRCKNRKMLPECINSHMEGTLGFSGEPEKIQFAPENF